MKKDLGKRFYYYFGGFIMLVIVFSSLASCNLFDRFTETGKDYENSWIVSGVARLYKSLDDISTYEMIDDLWVKKIGKCRKSKALESEILCPVKGIYTDQKGWVLEYYLIKFEDYLPGSKD